MKRHIKRLVFPKTWNISRKENTFVVRPKPSGHKLEYSMPINLILREMTGFANNRKEAQQIINARAVLLDGKKVKTLKRPAGLMDVLTFNGLDSKYVVTLAENGKLDLIEAKNPTQKVVKVVKKFMAKGGKISCVGHDGRIFQDASNDIKVGDSIVINLADQKVIKHLKLDKDSVGLFLAGKNIGKEVKLTNVVKTGTKEADYVEFELDGAVQKGRKSQFFVIGNKTSEL